MGDIFQYSSTVVYLGIGILSLVMAFKSLSAKKYLSFHEQASGLAWDSIDERLQLVIKALLRISGLGFLLVAVLLIALPLGMFWRPVLFLKYIVPVTALLFCAGLCIVNFDLYQKTKAATPWKKSLAVVVLIVVAIFLSGM